MTLHVEATGPQTLFQDLGRTGYASMGVTASGAFDRAAVRRGNRILGNVPGAATIEVLLGGLRLRAASQHLVCMTGAVGPVDIDGRPVAHERPVAIGPGQLLSIGVPTVGARTFLSIRGGFGATSTLGSRATDTLSGLGPAPVEVGDHLHACPWPGPPTGPAPSTGEPDVRLTSGEVTLRVVLGPHDDWFEAAAIDTLLQQAWTVSGASDRVGVRMDGPPLPRARKGELPTTGCIRGAIQVAADGQPIIFGPDHPVTGGYPVIGVIIDPDTDLLGQARAGQLLRFVRYR